MDKNIEQEIKDIVKKIVDNLKVNKIILFGSYAYGTPNEDSDLDLCVITEENKRKMDLMREIRKFVYDVVKRPLDILVYKPNEFYDRAESLKSIEQEILNKGIIV